MKGTVQFVPKSKWTPRLCTVIEYWWQEVSFLCGPVARATLEIVLVSKVKIRQLNKQYREIDKVTDVISLDFGVDRLGEKVGVIYIAPAVLRSVASQMGHSYEQELMFIVLHGLLHVWGYDHLLAADEKSMLAMKEMLLQNFPEYSPLLSTYRSRSLIDY